MQKYTNLSKENDFHQEKWRYLTFYNVIHGDSNRNHSPFEKVRPHMESMIPPSFHDSQCLNGLYRPSLSTIDRERLNDKTREPKEHTKKSER